MIVSPRVSVIIPQHGQAGLTARLVAQLRQYESPELEIIVVDDGSPVPDCFPWPDRFGSINLKQPHSGITAAWNRGAAATTGDVLVFLNNDVEVTGPFLERLIEPVRSGRAQLAGAEWRIEEKLPHALLDSTREKLVAGWCFALPRALFEQLHGFDSQFRLYFSDTDLQWRINEVTCRQGKAVVGDLPLHHERHATTRVYRQRESIWHCDRELFIRKWKGAATVVTPHLVQIGNAGRITGGTGACAWTVARALPDWKHTVLFRSVVDAETRRAFGPAEILSQGEWNWRSLGRFKPDLILLHNLSSRKNLLESSDIPTVNYLHSKVAPLPATRTVCCSAWLKLQLPRNLNASVLHQAVPVPPRIGEFQPSRTLRDELVVGRICTPSVSKWPASLVCWYRELAVQFPEIHWEFVGCPQPMQSELIESCRKRVTFHPPGFDARGHLWRWDALLYHHPTLTESFGRTVAEAMRAGCIPIVDDRGGFREQIVDETGFLCDSTIAFRHALHTLHDPGVRLRRSRRCRAHADVQFSLARFRRDLLNVFQQAVTAKSAAIPVSSNRRRSPVPVRR